MLKFFIGVLVGAVLGVSMMCLTFATKEADKAMGITDETNDAESKQK